MQLPKETELSVRIVVRGIKQRIGLSPLPKMKLGQIRGRLHIRKDTSAKGDDGALAVSLITHNYD